MEQFKAAQRFYEKNGFVKIQEDPLNKKPIYRWTPPDLKPEAKAAKPAAKAKPPVAKPPKKPAAKAATGKSSAAAGRHSTQLARRKPR
jgi:flagellar biosynthesis/type III secretory pathway protein FliH